MSPRNVEVCRVHLGKPTVPTGSTPSKKPHPRSKEHTSGKSSNLLASLVDDLERETVAHMCDEPIQTWLQALSTGTDDMPTCDRDMLTKMSLRELRAFISMRGPDVKRYTGTRGKRTINDIIDDVLKWLAQDEERRPKGKQE